MSSSENPFASPQFASESIKLPPRLATRQKGALLGISLLCGTTMGIITNSVNGALSPQYFRDVMRWSGENIWALAVRQGAVEGAVYALVYASIFIFLIATISRHRCTFGTALRYVKIAFALAFACWLCGGIGAVIFAWLFPDQCDRRFFGDRFWWPELGYYAWVRGSIWGAVYGGILSVLFTNTIYACRHRRADTLDYDRMVAAALANSRDDV